MTRVTSFLMPKRDQQASTFEEMQAAATPKADPLPKKEEHDNTAKETGKKQGKSRPNPQKRKRENRDKQAAAAAAGQEPDQRVESGPAQGWGKREDIMRKAQKSEQRRQGREQDRNSNTTCFACRAKGHAAKDCPNVLLAAANTDLTTGEEDDKGDGALSGESRGMKRKKGKKGADLAGSSGRCYRCDSSEHPLSRCPKPASVGLPYAHCFICLEKGHLASKCPSNSRGIYPNGGSCKVCGSVQHRAQDCPDDKRGKPGTAAVVLTEAEEELLKMKDDHVVLGTGREAGADEDDFMIVKRRKTEVERKHAEAQAQEKLAKKVQSAQQKRLLQRSQLAAGGDTEASSALSLLQSDQPSPVPHQEEALPVKVSQVARSAVQARSKPKVVVF